MENNVARKMENSLWKYRNMGKFLLNSLFGVVDWDFEIFYVILLGLDTIIA